MKAIISTIFSIIMFAGCAQPQTDAKIFAGSKEKPSANEAVATFAEGCFWHTEIVFQSLVGFVMQYLVMQEVRIQIPITKK